MELIREKRLGLPAAEAAVRAVYVYLLWVLVARLRGDALEG